MYTCDKCKGTSTDSKFCENPACPLMPCCMQVEEMCACDIESSFTPLDSKILNKIFEVSLINDTMKFFLKIRK
jgi:hypothetical protein